MFLEKKKMRVNGENDEDNTVEQNKYKEEQGDLIIKGKSDVMWRWEDANLEELKIKIARDSTAVEEEENGIAIQKKITTLMK